MDDLLPVSPKKREEMAEYMSLAASQDPTSLSKLFQVLKKNRDFSFKNLFSAFAEDKSISELHSRAEWRRLGTDVKVFQPVHVAIMDKEKGDFVSAEVYDVSKTGFEKAHPEGGISGKRVSTLIEALKRKILIDFTDKGYKILYRDKKIEIPKRFSVEEKTKGILYGAYRILLDEKENARKKPRWFPKRNLSEEERTMLSTGCSCVAGFLFNFEWKLTENMMATLRKNPRSYLEIVHEIARPVVRDAFEVIRKNEALRDGEHTIRR